MGRCQQRLGKKPKFVVVVFLSLPLASFLVLTCLLSVIVRFEGTEHCDNLVLCWCCIQCYSGTLLVLFKIIIDIVHNNNNVLS